MTTVSLTGATTATSLPGSASDARAAASSTSGKTCRMSSGEVRTTIVNVPVAFSPNCSSRILSARAVSVPGSVKRFVSRSASPLDAIPETTKIAIQTPSTTQRCRMTRRVQFSTRGG